MSKEPTKGGAPGKSPGTKAKRKLTRSEKKQIAAAIRQAKGDGKAHTAQQTIPYINLYPDGICRITEKKYSKSMRRCSVCGAPFASSSNRAIYCPDCRKRITRRQTAERMRKMRGNVTR